MTLEKVREPFYARPTYSTAVELRPIDLESSSTPMMFRFQSEFEVKASIATEENRAFVSIEEMVSHFQLAGFAVQFQMPLE